MNFNNFTIKSQEAVQEAVNLTRARGQQAIDPAHLMAAVMKVGDTVTNFLFQKLGVNAQQIAQLVERQMDSLPKVSGGEPYLSRETNEVLQRAVELSKEMGGQYVALEELVLNSGESHFVRRANLRIYPRIGQIYFTPASNWGRAPFYSQTKKWAGYKVSSFSFNLFVLGFFAILVIISIFAPNNFTIFIRQPKPIAKLMKRKSRRV